MAIELNILMIETPTSLCNHHRGIHIVLIMDGSCHLFSVDVGAVLFFAVYVVD